jgi:hypothetical protein
LARSKKWRKKGAKAFPLGTPLVSAGGVAAVGLFMRAKVGQNFCYPVLFENFADTGRVAHGIDFILRMVRASSVCAFLYQNEHAKFEFAYLRKNIGGAKRQQFLRCGNPKG